MKKMLNHFCLPVHFKYLFVFICVTSCFELHAQGVYRLNGSQDNSVKVSGKSNVHDWTMISKNPICEANFGTISRESGVPKNLSSLNFSLKSKSLKSESGSMDKRTYKAIKAEDYPDIDFQLSEAIITPLTENKFSVNATGTLTIAGVSKVINLQVNGDVNADHTILCTGQKKIKLTDFGIQPPSYMLGAMKVGNELTISFTLNFKK